MASSTGEHHGEARTMAQRSNSLCQATLEARSPESRNVAIRRNTSLGFSEEVFRRRYSSDAGGRRSSVAVQLLNGGSVDWQEKFERKQKQPESVTTGRIAPLVLLVLGIGCAAEASSEWLISRDSGCSSLIMVLSYLSSFAVSAPTTLRNRQESRSWSVPFFLHMILAGADVGYGQLMNQVYSTPLPESVILVLKNGVLVANLLVGALFMGRRYNVEQVLSVLAVTTGLVTTALTAQPKKTNSTLAIISSGARRRMVFGFAMMLTALTSRAFSNAVQELAMTRCTNGSVFVAECAFFTSLLGAPMEFMMAKAAVFKHWRRWHQPAMCGVKWPGIWLILSINIGLNYSMRSLVAQLIGRTSALSANITLTFQRFLSFALSSLVLNPAPGGPKASLWFGSLAVLGGAIAYAPASQKAALRDAQIKHPRVKEDEAESSDND